MEEIRAANVEEIAEKQNITSYFQSFVNWVDRGEKTTRTYLTNLRQFAAYLAYQSVTQPTRADIIAYRDYLLTEHDGIEYIPDYPYWMYRTDRDGHRVAIKCTANTVCAYIRTVKMFFRWTASEGLYPNIADNIHTPAVSQEHKKEALQASDVRAIESSIEEQGAGAVAAAKTSKKDAEGKTQRANEQEKRLFAMYLLAVNAGLRTIEISRLNCSDYVKQGGQAWLYIHGKGHVEADTKKAIAPAVATAIDSYLSTRSFKPQANGPLFVSTGNRAGGKRIATTTISTMLKRAMQAAGYDDSRLTAHSLRHTAGSAVLEMTGNNIFEAQKYMRHADPKTTEIYMHTNEEKLDAETANRLYNYYHNERCENV